MNDERLLMRAIDIGRLLGLNDRTISRWYNKGLVTRQDIGKYCIISVFKYCKTQLQADIETLQNKIANFKKQSEKKNLQVQKLEASIKIISFNASIKEHELQKLENNLVEVTKAHSAYSNTCSDIKRKSLALSKRVSQNIAKLDDPNQINSLLQNQISQLLVDFSA